MTTDNEVETSQSLPMTSRKRQLSTEMSPVISTKKMKISNSDIDELDIKQDHIPVYLLTNNALFIHMVDNLKRSNILIKQNDVQELAISIHFMAAFRIEKEIIEIYLKSMAGTLQELEMDLIEVDRRVCPVQLQSIMTEKEQYLQQCLLDLNQKISYNEQQFNQKKHSFEGFTSVIVEFIQQYVQDYGIKPLQVKCDLKLATVKYDYEAEILERKYLQEIPNQYQV